MLHHSRSGLPSCFPPPKFLPPFFFDLGQPRKNRLSVKFSSYATLGVAPLNFPKQITLLFSVPKILTAVFLIWGNPEKTAFPSSFSLMLLSGATPLFKRGRPPELPEANYPLVFRSQNSYRRFFDLGQPKKNRLSVKFFSYATFGVAPHFPKQITLLFSVPKILTAVFLIWGNPKKTAFPSSFSLMLLSGSPHTSQSKLPSCFPFPKFLPPFF